MSTYQSEEPPWPCWSLERVSRDSGGQRDAVHEPGTLQQTVNALLADELKRLLVQLGTEVAIGRSALGQCSCRIAIMSEYAPDWGLAHDVILHLELLHLTFADCAVLAFQELLLDLMPRADILPLQSYLNSGHTEQ